MQSIEENFKERAKILVECDKDSEYRKQILLACKADPCFFFDYFLFTDKNTGFFDGKTASEVPFVLFDFQRDFIKDLWACIQEGQKPISERIQATSAFIEKSRQMGVSWMLCGLFLYGFVFHGHKYLMISQKEDLVDKKGDMKSLFEKMRFMLRHLPDWMIPEGLSKDSETDCNKHMALSRKDNSGSITGESANPDASRGGTYAAIFMDEMPTMQNAQQIKTAASRASPCVFFNGTPLGKGNEYYRIRVSLEEDMKANREPRFAWFRLHWSEHPFYTKEWYEAQKRTMTPEEVAQELDINYNTSIIGRVYPEYDGTTVKAEYDDELPLFCAIDNSHGGADPHAFILCQIRNHNWEIVDYLEFRGTPKQAAALMAKNPIGSLSTHALAFFERYKDYKTPTFVSDPYDTKSALGNSSIFQDYSEAGIFLNLPMERDKQQQIRQTRNNMYRYKFGERAVDLAAAIANSRYPSVSENSNRTTPASLPVHDQWSHGRSALEYLTCFLLENPVYANQKKKVFDYAVRKDLYTGKMVALHG
jgi:hypothetical protein